ncbi:protection of telomeres 1 [Brachionus plicatilis]|uniref:Protection of telomeres protein 1 n=1 Tax=Brachionus plicatilis TaxID=10195 RepID=A0A3M7R4B8_BRAPC|nr:protection of telomeres 1 [Brachionus plicatilis]
MTSDQTETIHSIIANYNTANYQKINVYGIVTYIGSKSDKCTCITLVDDTCTETERLKCLVFDRNLSQPTSCELGDVVRLNRIKIQVFNGQPQAVCNNLFSSWIRFKRSDPQSYSGQSTTVNQDDLDRVKHLLNWLDTSPKNQALYEASLSVPREPSAVTDSDIEMAASVMNMQHLEKINHEPSKCELTKFSNVKKDTYVNIVCQICALCDNKGVKFVFVWDGTKPDFAIIQEKEFSIEQTKNKVLFSKKITEFIFTVYIFDEFVQQLQYLEPGDFVLFKNARVCPAPNKSDADLLIKMPGIQNSNQSRYGRSIQKICSLENAPQISDHGPEISQIIENLLKKSKEYDLNFVPEEQFRCEISAELFNDTFAELVEKNSKPTKKPTLLSLVNEIMNEDTQMYYSEEEAEPKDTQAMAENQNVLNQEPMIEDHSSPKMSKKIDPLAISQDIFMLKKLVNLTHICPYLSATSLGISTQMYQQQYPFYTNIKNLVEDSESKLYLKCKVIAKLYNFSAASSPPICMVFLKCKRCHYLNFTPIHLACAYQSAHLNNLLNISEVKSSSQLPGTAHQNATFAPFQTQENWQPGEQNGLNFSLDWLETATPSNFDPIACSQEQSAGSMINYGYLCPRCALSQDESQDEQILDYVYRLWLVMRDADAKLDPCLIEEDVAVQFLDGIEPIKFYTNQSKGHQVFKTIQKNFHKKFLFTIEMFNLKLIRNRNEQEEIVGAQSTKRLDYVYKIVKFEELVSS